MIATTTRRASRSGERPEMIAARTKPASWEMSGCQASRAAIRRSRGRRARRCSRLKTAMAAGRTRAAALSWIGPRPSQRWTPSCSGPRKLSAMTMTAMADQASRASRGGRGRRRWLPATSHAIGLRIQMTGTDAGLRHGHGAERDGASEAAPKTGNGSPRQASGLGKGCKATRGRTDRAPAPGAACGREAVARRRSSCRNACRARRPSPATMNRHVLPCPRARRRGRRGLRR